MIRGSALGVRLRKWAASRAQSRNPTRRGLWREPGQRPEFEEISVVLRGTLRVEYEGGTLDVPAGQAVIAHLGEWVRYSSPAAGGVEYLAVCLPAFTPAAAHRDAG